MLNQTAITLIDDVLHICRQRCYAQFVDFVELFGIGEGCTRHTRQMVVEAKIILQSDGGDGGCFALNANPFFGFDCFVQAVRIATAGHHPPREIINDDNFAALHHIFHIFFEHIFGAEGVVEIVGQLVKARLV